MDKDLVKVKLISGRYHRSNTKGSITIPLYLFYAIVAVQTALNELHQQAKLYAYPLKDKPMFIEKNHPIPVEPGEIIKFNQGE
jgi:hypothetical protein